jgi:hypothetical protein
LFLLIFSLIIFAGITFVSLTALLNIKEPYLISYIPIKEFADLLPFYPTLLAVYFSVLLPVIAAIIFSLSLFKKKNLFALSTWISLASIWVVAVVVFLSLCVSSAPKVVSEVKNNTIFAQNELSIPETDFNNIVVTDNEQNEMLVTITSADNFGIKAIGRNVDLENFTYKIEDKIYLYKKKELQK